MKILKDAYKQSSFMKLLVLVWALAFISAGLTAFKTTLIVGWVASGCVVALIIFIVIILRLYKLEVCIACLKRTFYRKTLEPETFLYPIQFVCPHCGQENDSPKTQERMEILNNKSL